MMTQNKAFLAALGLTALLLMLSSAPAAEASSFGTRTLKQWSNWGDRAWGPPGWGPPGWGWSRPTDPGVNVMFNLL